MDNFAPQLKQQGYTNQFREDYEFSVKQAGVGNADLLGQSFAGATDISATGYKIAEQYEDEEKEYQKEAKAKADEVKKERTLQTYNDFARKQMLINEKAEQTQQWTNRDLETRKLLDQYSRMPGIEYGKLLELSGKTDFTGYYGIEKNARQKYDTARIEQELKAWDAIVAANPEAGAAFTPKEGISYMNQVNNSWDAGMKDVAELKNIDKNANPHEYARVERNLINNLKDNIAATSILSIMRGTKGLQTDTEIQQFISKEQQRLVKAGVAPERAAIITQVGMQRSGILGVVKAINNEQTLYQEDVKRLMGVRETDGYVLMGATETPYAAMWVKTDDFRSGQYLQTEHRLADKYMRELIPALAESRGTNFTPIMSPEIRGNVYSMGSKIIKGNIGTPVLKGKVLGHMLSDAINFYGDQDAETRQQAYEAILKEFDNPYTDANIKALQSDADPFRRDMGNELAKQMQFLRDSKSISVFETSMTPAANSYRLLKQGPGADLLRVTEDGELVMVDGSKGFLQSTAITLSDMTGRYFGAAADMNKYFGEIYKDAETRKQMLEAGGIPELDPITETVIGRKEWYLGTGDNHIKARQQLEQNTQAGEWGFNAVEGLGGKIWEGIKENTKGKIENTVRLGKNTKEFLTVDNVTDNSPFTKAFGLTPKEAPSEIEKLEKTLENEDLKPHVRRAVEGTIEILKNQDGTTTARLSRSEPLTFAHLETPEVYKLMEEGTKAENKLLQSMGEHDTFLGVAEEELYQERKKSLPKALQSEKDYDLRGAYKAGLLDNVEEGMHLPDTFKKPNHITFSKESKYYEDGMWAGEWVDNNTFKIPLNTPKAKLAKLKEYFAKYEPGARIMIDNPKALEELRKIEGEEDNISKALSSDPYMHEGYANMYEADKEKLMNKRHRVLKDIYIYPGE